MTQSFYPLVRRQEYRKTSRVLLEQLGLTLWIEVETSQSKAFRRQILLIVFRALKKSLRELQASSLQHSDSSILEAVRNLGRPVSLHRALSLETQPELEGSEIRLKRLHFGLTQEAFAKAAGIHRCHLSRIERGRLAMTPLTRMQIEKTIRGLKPMHKKSQLLSRGGRVLKAGTQPRHKSEMHPEMAQNNGANPKNRADMDRSGL